MELMIYGVRIRSKAGEAQSLACDVYVTWIGDKLLRM